MSDLTRIPVRTGIKQMKTFARAILGLWARWSSTIKKVLSPEAFTIVETMVAAIQAFVDDVADPVAGDPLP
jgi:hypothetical protein